ncbi:MAG: DUF1127 domain-containing protein [Burkholderiales bacterium]|nr:DUF1127 domain-containing protein [Burkholderiales bacterium]
MRVFQQFLTAFARWNRRRITIRELTALPDWVLKDIGVTRGEIPRIVDETMDVVSPLAKGIIRTPAIPKTESAPPPAAKAA